MNKRQGVLGRYTNFSFPSVKLIEKARVGSKVTRGYNKSKTLCRRIIKSNEIPWKIKEKFTEQCNSLTLAELKRVISITCKKEII